MASESRNLAQQRREKDGIVYFERGILTGRDGRRYQRYAIQTHFVEVGESAAELVKKYVLPLAQPGDVLSITAKVMAMCTGNVRRMEDMKLGFFAKHMAKFAGINSTGVGMHEPYKLQLVIDMVGLPRVLLAAFCSAVTKLFGKKGVFYKVCGHEVEGIDGLIHISDLSWTKKIKHPGEFTSVGAEIEVVVLEVDKENRRLSLGHKQLEENPWNEFEGQFAVDSVHEGTITEMTDKGAVVSLGENVEGFAPMRQLVKEDGTTATVGEKLPFKVIEFSKATKRITLSHTRLFEEAKRAERAEQAAEKKASAEATKSSMKKINASVEKTTLGDIAGLAELKDAMEAAAKEEK